MYCGGALANGETDLSLISKARIPFWKGWGFLAPTFYGLVIVYMAPSCFWCSV